MNCLDSDGDRVPRDAQAGKEGGGEGVHREAQGEAGWCVCVCGGGYSYIFIGRLPLGSLFGVQNLNNDIFFWGGGLQKN